MNQQKYLELKNYVPEGLPKTMLSYMASPGIEAKTRKKAILLSSKQMVLNAIKLHFGVNYSELISPIRKSKIVEARRVFCYLMYEKCRAGSSAIGNMIDKDHATVIYHCKVVRQEMEIYPEKAKLMKHLLSLIKDQEV